MPVLTANFDASPLFALSPIPRKKARPVKFKKESLRKRGRQPPKNRTGKAYPTMNFNQNIFLDKKAIEVEQLGSRIIVSLCEKATGPSRIF